MSTNKQHTLSLSLKAHSSHPSAHDSRCPGWRTLPRAAHLFLPRTTIALWRTHGRKRAPCAPVRTPRSAQPPRGPTHLRGPAARADSALRWRRPATEATIGWLRSSSSVSDSKICPQTVQPTPQTLALFSGPHRLSGSVGTEYCGGFFPEPFRDLKSQDHTVWGVGLTRGEKRPVVKRSKKE